MVLAIVAAIACFFIGVSLSSGIVIPDGIGGQIYWTFISLLGSLYIAVILIRKQEFDAAKAKMEVVHRDLTKRTYKKAEESTIKFHTTTEDRKRLLDEYMLAWRFFYYRGYKIAFQLDGIKHQVLHWQDCSGSRAEAIHRQISNNFYFIQNLNMPVRGFQPWPIYKNLSPP